jgi:hypothetical protein
MNHSLITASRTTHLKILVVALVASILVVTVGITGHGSDVQVSARAPATGAVVKAGHPVTYTRQDGPVVR